MGFFSNIKNAITGGAATVSVQVPQHAQRGTVAMINIAAQAKAAGNVAGVYLLVRAIERAQIRDRDFEGGHTTTETVRGSYTSWEHRIPVAGAFQMQEGQQMQWQAQFHVPQDGQPTLNGHMISHKWEVQAGLDMTGNDPDSGWVEIIVW